MPEDQVRLSVLISGNGTNLQALIDAESNGTLENCHIVRVLSNKKAAFGLQRAEKANIPTAYHNLVPYKKRYPDDVMVARLKYDEDLAKLVLSDEPDLIVCAGFMHILAPAFLDPVVEANVRIINLHPALPGQFNGINAIERAQEAWLVGSIDKTGVMIHKVIPEVDMGEPILVKEIPFVRGVDEDIEALKDRFHAIEHQAIVQGTAIMVQEINRTGEKKK